MLALSRVLNSDHGGYCLGPVWPLWGTTYLTGAHPAGAEILHRGPAIRTL